MISTKSSPKPTVKDSSDDSQLTFDLVSNLTYMAALAVSESSRDRIFELAITQAYRTTFHFRRVYVLVKRLGFEYSKAFQLVAKKAAARRVKSLLLRFANSIGSGESELGFLTQEARIQTEVYNSEYNRKLESLQKWSDAFAALIVSVSVIIVAAMVSTMLYDVGPAFVVFLSLTAVFMSLMGSFVIYTSSPVELVTYKNRKGPKIRRWAVGLFYALGPLGAVLSLQALQFYGPGPAYVILGLSMAPSGILAFIDDMKVRAIDLEIAGFLRALGSVTGSLGSTLTRGLEEVDIASTGSLQPHLVRLRSRLASRLDPDICWDAFRDEVGSELVNRSTRMMVDGVGLGGDAEKVGRVASDYALNIALLRGKRAVTSSTFQFLTFPLHATMVGLLVFILEVLEAFNTRLSSIADFMANKMGASGAGNMPALPMFQPKDLTLVSQLLMIVIIGFTLANTVAPKFATGGHPAKFLFFASITTVLTGICLITIPPVARLFLA